MFSSAIKEALSAWIRDNRYRLNSIIENAVENVMSAEKCESIVTSFVERKTEEFIESYDESDFDDYLEEELESYD